MPYSYSAVTLGTTALYSSASLGTQIDSIPRNTDITVTTCGSQKLFTTTYGSTGYVLAKQVYIRNGKAAATIYGQSSTDYSNLRELPNSSSTRLAKLYPATEVTVLDESSGSYERVSTTSGTGWVLSSSLYYG